MALPKRKTSKARRGKRRSHLGLSPPQLDYCPQCHSPKLPHHVCPVCGSYAGREVTEVEGPKPPE
ncbi:MAG: 50S ribosomal protein L32 [Dehalococcoidales bacterium]